MIEEWMIGIWKSEETIDGMTYWLTLEQNQMGRLVAVGKDKKLMSELKGKVNFNHTEVGTWSIEFENPDVPSETLIADIILWMKMDSNRLMMERTGGERFFMIKCN